MSIDQPDEWQAYGFDRGDARARPPRGAERAVLAGGFALLLGPPIATLGFTFAQLALAEPRSGLLALTWAALTVTGVAYVIYGVPAFVAGAIFGALSNRAPNLAASLAIAALTGFAVTTLYAFLLSSGDDDRLLASAQTGLLGAATTVACAAWLEYRWRHPLKEPRRRKAAIALFGAVAVFLSAIVWAAGYWQ